MVLLRFKGYKMRTLARNELTLFFPKFPFDSPENVRKPEVFYTFSGGSKGNIEKKGLNFSFTFLWAPTWVSLKEKSENTIESFIRRYVSMFAKVFINNVFCVYRN